MEGKRVNGWLSKLLSENKRLRRILDYSVINKIEGLGEDVLRDLEEAWRLNKVVNDFHSLLNGLSVAVDHHEYGENFYLLLHECVKGRDLERIRFLERGYGWIAEVRKMNFEMGQKPAEIVYKAFSFVKDVLDSDLDAEGLARVSRILKNLLESRGRREAYREMIRLKRHLFVEVGLGGGRLKRALLAECLEKWEEASRLSDAVVSHQTLDASGHFRARSPVKVNYLDAGGGRVIPIVADKEKEGGYGITIPENAAEYLGLRDEGFVILRRRLGDAMLFFPMAVGAEGKVALSGFLEKLLRAMFSEHDAFQKYLDEDGRVKWGLLERDRVALRFKAVDEEAGRIVERTVLLKDPRGRSIRLRLGGELENRMVILSGFALELQEN
ncbi:MAG: hypothetical protein FGF53_04565 [Candidatus Brockarchaeota archaeon]|nr:hypothetical protein [Candidatus Brockarchaeota archaeon]MBO3808982.1 hypothetical protein [Candidatus Brockarchaeota archaeon]